MTNYHIAEPHPSVPTTHYMHTGRGGAGNISYVDPSAVTKGPDASGPASQSTLTTGSTSSAYHAGRGGLGNIHPGADRAIFSFDEELERQRRLMEHQAPVFHVGRGGAGNLATDPERMGTRSNSSAAWSSNRGSLEAAWDRVRSSFSK